jgi:hypothetical protein
MKREVLAEAGGQEREGDSPAVTLHMNLKVKPGIKVSAEMQHK